MVQSAVEVAGGGMTTDDRIAMTTDDLMTDGTLLMTATGAAGVCVCVCVCVICAGLVGLSTEEGQRDCDR